LGAQLTVQAREWYLAIGLDLGMTHAQTIGVIATTEQSAGRG
jgi:hypothetical protein